MGAGGQECRRLTKEAEKPSSMLEGEGTIYYLNMDFSWNISVFTSMVIESLLAIVWDGVYVLLGSV